MLSALKKLTNKQDVITVPPDTAGHPMSGSLQKKFSRGVNYNMKIIIKGDRNVGKSCLLQRLQGGGFIEMYTPTEEIQVASIQWSFKATEDIVKVEVWDVVDRGKARQRHTGLKLSTNCQLPEQPALDAEFLDVYKGTHGVILMMDVTKSWTFDYVTRELPKIPTEIPVLILGNHCDMSHHRVISIGQATSLIETFGENRPAEVLYAESSMRNGFGLRLLHKFLGLPFLRLQKETLLALIERNKRDTEICGFEIAEFLKSDDADYNKFLNNLSNKRRQIAESNSRVPPPPSPLSTPSSTLSLQQHQQQQQQISSSSSSSLSHSASNSSISSQLKIINGNGGAGGNGTAANNSMQSQEFRPTKSIIIGGGQPIIIPGQINVTQQIKQQQQQQQQQKSQNNSSTNKIGNITLPSGTTLDIPQKDLVNALLQKSCDLKNSNNNNNNTKQSIDEQQRKIASLDEFCPDDGSILDKNFLDDMISTTTTTTNISAAITSNHVESDSDNDDAADGGGNPMVAKFYDEPDYDNDDDDGNDDDNDNLNSEKLKNLKIKNETNTKSIKTNPLAKHHQKRKSLINDEQLLISNSNSNNEDVVGIKRTSSMIEQLKLSSSPSSSSIPYEDNSDNNNSWLPEISVRQSPEGGEDTTVIPNNNQDLGIIKQQQQQQTKSLKLQQQENDDKDKLMENDYDNHHNTITSSSSSGTTEKRHKHKKHKKDKDKKDKDYDCKRDDDKKKKKKRSSTSSSSSSKLINKQTDLEEFLNGTSADFSSRIDEAYEAI